MAADVRFIRRSRTRAGRAFLIGWLPLALVAQALPGLPPAEPGPAAPGLGELLPLRPLGPLANPDSSAPLRLRGNNIQEGPDGWILEEGAVQSNDLLLLADRIVFHSDTKELEAEGHIRLEGPGVRLRCGRLRMGWKEKAGEAWAVELELPPSWVLRSQKVAFNTMKHWAFDQVELSPCPQEKPGWKALVSKLSVDLNDYATIRNLWIWVGSVPTFYYLPWAIYPAKAERTSGLLPISFSFSGPYGASLGLPLYKVLGDSADATLSPEFYRKQGVLWGGELRWNPETTHQGSIQGQRIHQKLDGEDRYRFSLKELWQREDGWQLSADINQASDAMLDADYGKGIGRLGTTTFDSAFFLGRNAPWASFNLTASDQRTFFTKDDKAYYRPDFPAFLQRQVLPSLQARVYPVPLGNFYFDGGVQLSRLGYKPDLGTEGQEAFTWNRQDVFARMQGRLGQLGPFRADLQTQARLTYYSASLGGSVFDPKSGGTGLDLSDPASPFKVNGPAATRTLGSMRIQFSAPPVGRTFQDVHLFGYSGELKHVLNPYFAVLETSPSSSEGRLPHFDEVDNTPGVNSSYTGERSVELGVKQHILGRGGPGTTFADLVRWRVSARFHMRPILLADGRSKKGWASLDNDLDLEPNDKLRISFRRSSDLADSSADNSLSADFKTGDGSRLNLAYFNTGINRFLVRQNGIQLGGLQRLWDDRIRLEFQSNYDFHAHNFASSQIGLAYVTPCVSTSLRFSHVTISDPLSRSKEDRLDLVMTLRALGDLFSNSF